MADRDVADAAPLAKFYLTDTLPSHVKEVGQLLDANITKPEHVRPGVSDDWYLAIKDRKLCRIPAFRQSYELATEVIEDGSKKVFRARLHDQCGKNTRHIDGSSSSFAVGRVDDAENGALLTFDRAVVLIFSFNEIVVREIHRLTGMGEQGASKVERLRGILLPWHSVAISCFYFANMRPAVAAAVKHFDGSLGLIDATVRATDQPYDVVRDLLVPSNTTIGGNEDREVTHCGSYLTLRRIYKFLEEIKDVKAQLDRVPRDAHIQRLHVAIGNKKALESERVVKPQAITRPPYNWPESSAGIWPEED